MPFLRERAQSFGQQLERFHFQCWFPAFGDKTGSFHSDEIAEVEQLKKVDQLRADFFRVNIDLNAPCRVAQIKEMTLAHVAMRRDAARCAKGLAFPEPFAHLRNRSGHLKATTEWVKTLRAKRVELFAPQCD